MSTADVTVELAGIEDMDAVALILASAFEAGDYANWLVPDELARHLMYPPYFKLLLEPAFDHGQVEVTSDGSAVAVWYRGTGSPPAPANYKRRRAAICGARTPWFQLLDIAQEQHHPQNMLLDYLAFVAVRPGRQRRGVGSLLLGHHHALADAAQVPCYLEATGIENSALYERLGYRRCEPFALADSGPTAHPMLRPASPVVAVPPSSGWAVGQPA